MSFTSASGKSALPPLRPLPATKASPKIQGIYPSQQNYIQRLPDFATGPISVPQRAPRCISSANCSPAEAVTGWFTRASRARYFATSDTRKRPGCGSAAIRTRLLPSHSALGGMCALGWRQTPQRRFISGRAPPAKRPRHSPRAAR